MRRTPLVALAGALALAGLTGCGSDTKTAAPTTTATAASTGASTTKAPDKVAVRLGYFPNVTHASALVGVEEGFFAKHLPEGATLETKTFNAGGDAVTALFADALDITYVGPNPSINAFTKSKGEAVRVVSGATSGGALLVTKPTITAAADLKGKKIATPQLGGTQDVAARAWLKAQGLTTDANGGGDVSITPQDNGATLDAFKAGNIDGAWVPEPWATRLVTEGGGKVLLDEKTLWPDGKWVTTQILVRTQFLKDHPGAVQAILEGQVDANDLLASDPSKAKADVATGIQKVTNKPIAASLIDASFKNMAFTNDPIASSLAKIASDAKSVGLLKDDPGDLTKIYDLALLNKVLTAAGKPTVAT